MNDTSALTNLVERGAVLVDVDTSSDGVTFYFRTDNGSAVRVETWPGTRHNQYDPDTWPVVNWTVTVYEGVTNA